MLSQKFRFHGHNALRFVYKNGQAKRSQYLTMKTTPNTRRQHSRLAVVISKKVIKSAVGRNRVRRRLYELLRLRLDDIAGVHDIVCIVTSPEVRTMKAHELEEAVDLLLIASNLYKPDAKNAIIRQINQPKEG